MATQYTEEFKKDAVKYRKEHPELGINKCAKNLGISKSALSNWIKSYTENEGFSRGKIRFRYRARAAFHFRARRPPLL